MPLHRKAKPPGAANPRTAIESNADNENTAGIDPSQPSSFYYDARHGHYWTAGGQGEYICQNLGDVKRRLRAAGVSSEKPVGMPSSPMDLWVIGIQNEWAVAYVGPLAGYRAGHHRILGSRILVTKSPQIIEPVRGDWPTLEKLFENLFADDTVDQRPYVFGWIKVGYEALRAGRLRPGQALAICGPRDCGKSLVQNLFTKILGGRSAKPYQFMSGQTPFNGDLLGAEHLMIEDDIGCHDIRARRNLGASIKAFTVNETQRCHAKGKDGVALTPFHRVTITINDEPENLLILPPMDESMRDKITLLRAFKKPMPMPTGTLEERAQFMGRIESELPGFLHDLVNNFTIPADLRCERFGVTHFHHPDLLSELNALAPEAELLGLVDEVVFGTGMESKWTGTAAELERLLREKCPHESNRLLKFANNCGTYLQRLESRGTRVTPRRTATRREWIITRAIE